ncbi:MAG: pyruvate kinase [Desulfurococcales archaeon]|nr:pyruvate kinase [Desulfurococcales archaeon]
MFRIPPVKVVATLGPSCSDARVMGEMIRAGARGFRINTSHGDPDEWASLLDAALRAEAEAGLRTALIIDLEGPRVRVSHAIEPVRVGEGEKVSFCPEGGQGCIQVTDPALFDVVEEGDSIILGDGVLTFTVSKVTAAGLEAVSNSPGTIRPGMGVALKGKDLPLPPVTEKDERAIKFMAGKPFSHVMMSYVRDPQHIKVLREKLEEHAVSGVEVLAKIETPGGVRNAPQIALESDGIVVARGDLGMHYPLETMPQIQAKLSQTAVQARKTLVIATELLTSMIQRPTPTRSEITDIYQAAREGADALLLTAETAIGKHPVRAVKWAIKAARAAAQTTQPPRPQRNGVPERLANGLVDLAESIQAPLLVYSKGGRLPKRIAALKPKTTVIAGVNTTQLERQLTIRWGITPIHIPAETYTEGLEKLHQKLRTRLAGRTVVLAAWSRHKETFEIKIKNIKY